MSQLHAGQDTKPQEGDSTSRGPRPGARLGSLSSCQRGVPRRALCGLVALAGTSLHAGLGPEDNLAGCREAAGAGGAESGVTGHRERVEGVGVRKESGTFARAALQSGAAVPPGWKVCFKHLRKLSVVTQAILNVKNISSVKGVKDFPGRLGCVSTQALFAVATFQGNFSAPRWTHGGRLRGSRMGRWARRHLTF